MGTDGVGIRYVIFGRMGDITEQLVTHLTTDELEAGLETLRQSPSDGGEIVLLTRRPAVETRESLDEATLDLVEGLVGDNWRVRGSSSTPDGRSSPEAQLTIMNSRAASLVAVDDDRRILAGDQVYADLDLSIENLPPGTRLRLGTAVVEVSAKPHTGCSKFVARFGKEAMRFVNSPLGRDLRLRGMNTRIVAAGVVRVGDRITKVGESA
jgi:hypothetical protein